MRIPQPFARFMRRKATIMALVACVFTWAFCWWWLPPTSLFVLDASGKDDVPALSRSMRYLATSKSDPPELTIWNIETGTALTVATEHFDLLREGAFTEDEKWFAEFRGG